MGCQDEAANLNVSETLWKKECLGYGHDYQTSDSHPPLTLFLRFLIPEKYNSK